MRRGRIIAYVLLGLWTLVCLGPLYWLAIASLKSPAALLYGPVYVPGLDFDPTLDSWRDVFETGDIGKRYSNSVVVAVSSTAVTMLASILVLHGRHGRLIAALTVSRIIPPIALILPTYLAASAVGLLDTRTLLVGVYTALNMPVALWLLRPVFSRRIRELEEAAALDGASRLHVLIDIVVPSIMRPLAAVAVLVFVLCWNEYLLAAFLTGGSAQTLSPFLVGQMSIREQQAGSDPDEISRLAAATVLMIVPLWLLVAWAEKALALEPDQDTR
jgi:multiple sugar transport system permease protein